MATLDDLFGTLVVGDSNVDTSASDELEGMSTGVPTRICDWGISLLVYYEPNHENWTSQENLP